RDRAHESPWQLVEHGADHRADDCTAESHPGPLPILTIGSSSATVCTPFGCLPRQSFLWIQDMLIRDRFFIGGQWVAPSGAQTIDVHNAGTGEVMGRVPAGTEKDIDAAVAAARGALESWSQTAPEKRAELLEKISAALKARADELARTIAQEVGMPLKMASRIQAGLPIANFANYARLVKEFSFETRVGNSLVVRERIADAGLEGKFLHQPCIVGEVRDRQAGLDAARHLEGHADFLRDRPRELVGARLERRRNFFEKLGPLLRRGLTPRLEGAARGGDRRI